MEESRSAELALAEAVAEKTVLRLRAELEDRDARLRQLWQQDLGKLRDDLTTKRLLEELKGMAMKTAAENPVRVLVVDDYPEIRGAFVKIFTRHGMLVQEAASSTEAITILESDLRIEVVLTDISMPKNGYTLLEHVRKVHPVIEVIMTSGFDTEAERARDLGAFGFLPKPFNLAQAVLIVERAAEFRRLKLATSSKG